MKSPNGASGQLFASYKRPFMRKTAEDRFAFSSRFLLRLICWVSALFVANDARAAFGDILAEYTFPASSLVMSPTEPLMYATIPIPEFYRDHQHKHTRRRGYHLCRFRCG